MLGPRWGTRGCSGLSCAPSPASPGPPSCGAGAGPGSAARGRPVLDADRCWAGPGTAGRRPCCGFGSSQHKPSSDRGAFRGQTEAPFIPTWLLLPQQCLPSLVCSWGSPGPWGGSPWAWGGWAPTAPAALPRSPGTQPQRAGAGPGPARPEQAAPCDQSPVPAPGLCLGSRTRAAGWGWPCPSSPGCAVQGWSWPLAGEERPHSWLAQSGDSARTQQSKASVLLAPRDLGRAACGSKAALLPAVCFLRPVLAGSCCQRAGSCRQPLCDSPAPPPARGTARCRAGEQLNTPGVCAWPCSGERVQGVLLQPP